MDTCALPVEADVLALFERCIRSRSDSSDCIDWIDDRLLMTQGLDRGSKVRGPHLDTLWSNDYPIASVKCRSYSRLTLIPYLMYKQKPPVGRGRC